MSAFWKAITSVSVLDPTCGSGAFLFAALNILEPLYTACLEAMEDFLDELDHSRRPHSPQAMSDFRKILAHVGKHASPDYFILKSIVVGNLYGVDIMEEAVEICKLRLFLKLVAQLKSYKQIEPLPDIDFNVRAGNTLVGFTSLDEVKRAILGDWIKEQALPDIEERAELADRAFRKFREMQTQHGMDASEFADAKLQLRERLDALRDELDRYLATGEYAVKEGDEEAYEQWRASHQPFHWFVEFYGIMHAGGFDVIIGNPPYLETKEVPYSTRYFETENSRAIHAMCIERSLALSGRKGHISMIVPLALVSTQRMTVVQRMLESNHNCWYANCAERPGKLFDTVNRPLTIFVSIRTENKEETFSTCYLKWHSQCRNYLMPTIRFLSIPRDRRSFWAPKLGDVLESSMLAKVSSAQKTLGEYVSTSDFRIYYRTTGGRYWKVFTDFSPTFLRNGAIARSSRETNFSLAVERYLKPTIAMLSSDVFWWWYSISSNMRDLNPSDWQRFPIPDTAMTDVNLCSLGTKYIEDIRKNSTMRIQNVSTGRTEIQFFKVQMSKPIIDQIDRVLASHYGFSDEELDFIINYDIKYRMGL